MELRIDPDAVKRCRSLASAVVAPVSTFIAGHSTVAVERSVLRLLGIDGISHDEIPLPNAILDGLAPDRRGLGIAVPFGRALPETGLAPQAVAEALAAGSLALDAHDDVPAAAARGAPAPYV